MSCKRLMVGRVDVNGNNIFDGDVVHCWDGTEDQQEVTASLVGVVKAVQYSDAVQFEVDENELALGCAEFVEVIDKCN